MYRIKCFIYNNVLYSVRNQQISLVEVTADEFYQQLKKQLWSVSHQTAAVVYADRDWRVSYEALMAVDVATMRA